MQSLRSMPNLPNGKEMAGTGQMLIGAARVAFNFDKRMAKMSKLHAALCERRIAWLDCNIV